MLKTLVLVATLGGLATLPEPAAAARYGPGDQRTTSSFGLQVVIQPAPKIVRHHHHGPRQLRPQPVFRFAPPRSIDHRWRPPAVRHFWHPSPRPGWQRPWHRAPHHVERRFHGSEPWRQGKHQWRHGFERHRGGARDWHQGNRQHRTGRGRNRH